MPLSHNSASAVRNVGCTVVVFIATCVGIARSPSGPIVDPAACAAVIYVVSLYCFQTMFMEWPFFDCKVMCLLIVAHVNFVMPTVMSSSGVMGTFWKDTCIAWCPYIWLSSATVAITAYFYMVVGPSPSNRSPRSLAGRVCIITGSNTGIGYETAEEFARLGATVIFACRSKDKACTAIQAVEQRVPSSKGRLHFIALDLSSMDSVRQFVRAFEATGMDVHVLVANAGVMLNARHLSKDGIEMTLASNLLGHFLLVQLLLPRLLSGEARGFQPRIINIGSTFHLCHDRIDFEEFVAVDAKNVDSFMDRPYEMFDAYGHSKLGGVLLSGELARRLARKGSRIPANMVHPGQCVTEVQRSMHPILLFWYSALYPVALLYLKLARVGSLGTVHLATAAELATSDTQSGGISGAWFLRMKPAPFSDAAKNQATAARLWDVVMELTGAPDV